MKYVRIPVAVSMVLMATVTVAMAQETGLCEAQDSSTFISVALCPEGISQEGMGKSGMEICGERLPCGVWFWTDQDKMPDKAPVNHDGLTQEQITSAIAVWVGEENVLISIEELMRE